MEIAASVKLAALAAPASASPAVPLAPDDLASARFNEVMNANPTPVTQAIGEAFPAAVTTERKSLGDAILSGMQNLSADFRQSWQTVNAALDGGNLMTMSEMLKLQMGLVQVSLQYDMVGKAISRTTQNIDQLVKMQ
jgi:type III secretion protein I